MLDNMKMLGALTGLMKNKDKLRGASERVKVKMEALRVTGESGGGACRAVVSGSMKVIDVTLSPAAAAGFGTGPGADIKTQAMASALICEAVNAALVQAQARLKQAIDEEAKALGLGDVMPDLGRLVGAG